MSSTDCQKIIIDTDCGIDDSIALILALSSKDIAEVIAITCCFGNTSLENVCSNVKRVLTVCNEKEIPIHRGCEGPLITRQSPVTVHGSDGLGESAHLFSTGDLEESDIHASVALINLAKKYPKQITVIAIGPLTNLAVAHRMDSSFFENLKSVVIMGGNYKGIGNVTEVAEFNFYCDPEAANIVVSEAKCSVVLVPWETTMEYGIKWDFYSELLSVKSRKGVFFNTITNYASIRGRSKGNNQLYDCDFLAVLCAFYPQSVTSSFQSNLRVECDGQLTLGMTILMRDPSKVFKRDPVRIITDFDMDFKNTILKETLSADI